MLHLSDIRRKTEVFLTVGTKGITNLTRILSRVEGWETSNLYLQGQNWSDRDGEDIGRLVFIRNY